MQKVAQGKEQTGQLIVKMGAHGKPEGVGIWPLGTEPAAQRGFPHTAHTHQRHTLALGQRMVQRIARLLAPDERRAQGRRFQPHGGAQPLQKEIAQPLHGLAQMTVMGGARNVQNVAIDCGLVARPWAHYALKVVQFQHEKGIAIVAPRSWRCVFNQLHKFVYTLGGCFVPQQLDRSCDLCTEHASPRHRFVCSMFVYGAAEKIGRGQR